MRNFNTLDTDTSLGSRGSDNTRTTEESHANERDIVGNGLGTGQEQTWAETDGDDPLKVEAILARFKETSILRFKPTSETPQVYEKVFRDFASFVKLERYSRRQLASRGKALLVSFVATVPLRSRRWCLSALRCVWETGLEDNARTDGLVLSWPIKKGDVGRLPNADRKPTPRDESVQPWVKAADQESDPYLKALLLVEMTFGWRPGNQLGHLQRRNIRLRNGRPFAVIARGTEQDFKTHSDIVAWLPKDVAEALDSWLKESPVTAEGSPVFPWRNSAGRYDLKRAADTGLVERLLRDFERRHRLPHVTPVEFRHWVKGSLRRHGLGGPAKAAWQGHDPAEEAEIPMDS